MVCEVVGSAYCVLDDRTSTILSKTHIPVGVFIDKNFITANRILVPIGDSEDVFLLNYVQRFIANNKSQVIIAELKETLKSDHAFKERLRQIEQTAPNHISIFTGHVIGSESFHASDLMVISITTWTKLVQVKNKSLADAPSTLILKK